MFSIYAFLFTFALASQERLISQNQRLQATNGILLKALRHINEEAEVGYGCYDSCRSNGGSFSECNYDCAELSAGEQDETAVGEIQPRLPGSPLKEEEVGCDVNRPGQDKEGGICDTDQARGGSAWCGYCKFGMTIDRPFPWTNDWCCNREESGFGNCRDICRFDLREISVGEENVGSRFNPMGGKCAKRGQCIIDCVAGDDSKRYECMKEVCPKDLCVEAV